MSCMRSCTCKFKRNSSALWRRLVQISSSIRLGLGGCFVEWREGGEGRGSSSPRWARGRTCAPTRSYTVSEGEKPPRSCSRGFYWQKSRTHQQHTSSYVSQRGKIVRALKLAHESMKRSSVRTGAVGSNDWRRLNTLEQWSASNGNLTRIKQIVSIGYKICSNKHYLNRMLRSNANLFCRHAHSGYLIFGTAFYLQSLLVHSANCVQSMQWPAEEHSAALDIQVTVSTLIVSTN
jgi:hypothetical protein